MVNTAVSVHWWWNKSGGGQVVINRDALSLSVNGGWISLHLDERYWRVVNIEVMILYQNQTIKRHELRIYTTEWYIFLRIGSS